MAAAAISSPNIAMRSCASRWAISQGINLFNAAAADPDHHPDVLAILAKNTVLNKPELVKAIAPHWSVINADGAPNVKSIMDMQACGRARISSSWSIP